MAKITSLGKINKTAKETRQLINRLKRKLLELDVLLSYKEIKSGDFEIFESAKDLINAVK